jgi:hypothetical protein
MTGVLFSLLSLLTLLGPAASLADNANIVRTATGEYSYINQETNEIVGHEDWSLFVDPDGSRTFTIAKRWDERDIVTRTILRLDANLRPIETYQTRWDEKGWASSGLYTVVENTVIATVMGRGGRATQILEVPEVFSMVPHPLTTDGLHFWYVDSPVGETIKGTVYNIKKRDELSGGVLGVVHSVDITYLGKEPMTTEAGVFDTKHFKMGEGSDFWVDVRDGVLVRLSYGTAGTRYDLTAYERNN